MWVRVPAVEVVARAIWRSVAIGWRKAANEERAPAIRTMVRTQAASARKAPTASPQRVRSVTRRGRDGHAPNGAGWGQGCRAALGSSQVFRYSARRGTISAVLGLADIVN